MADLVERDGLTYKKFTDVPFTGEVDEGLRQGNYKNGGPEGPNALRETPKARAALSILEKHGWLVALEAGTILRGAARKEAWHVIRVG